MLSFSFTEQYVTITSLASKTDTIDHCWKSLAGSKSFILILLDLSVVFDTVNYQILLVVSVMPHRQIFQSLMERKGV